MIQLKQTWANNSRIVVGDVVVGTIYNEGRELFLQEIEKLKTKCVPCDELVILLDEQARKIEELKRIKTVPTIEWPTTSGTISNVKSEECFFGERG